MVSKEGSIQEKLWKTMISERIEAKKKYMIFKNEQIIHLEFAIFYKERNIDVECDADGFHTRIEDIKQYRQGNNILERLGSTELCYPADEIKNNIA